MGRSRRFRLKLMKCVRIPRVLSAASFGSKSSSVSLKNEFPSLGQQQQQQERWCDDDDDDIHEEEDGNKIMVVLNSSLEAKCALDWALSHAVQPQDSVLLLHPLNNPSSSQGRDDMNEVLVDMKKKCQMKRARVKVRVVKVEGGGGGEEEGRAIVEEAKQQRVTLLVIGQRKRKRSVWRGLLRRLWANSKSKSRAAGNYYNGSGSSAVADYCIRNASCMTIAVTRNNNKLGGYLITTKRHQNFWLLA